MPTVLRANGFRVAIFPPGREHGPPHVHVFVGGGEAKILIPLMGEDPLVRYVRGMREDLAWEACRLIARHDEFLLAKWRELHDA
ncbi:MAG: DUF4160 domain-containing protein [Gemmatimonadaceae bacterium]|nr:DUF4160 domain-containing protein [Gemmatimonadaceae bacterium]MCW5826322.1 DUF4160 domain-containing protein [Gemmatimonadaceae bacterium]